MAYRSSTQNNANTVNLTVAVPAGVQADDIVILFTDYDRNPITFTWPSGFIQLTSDTLSFDGEQYAIAWKRLTGADTGSYAITSNAPVGNDYVISALALSGRDTSNPPVLGTVTKANSSHTGTVSFAAAAVTALNGDDIIWLAGTDQNSSAGSHSWTAPANYTLRTNPSRVWEGHATATRDNVSAGSTGTVTGTDAVSGTAEATIVWLIRVPAANTGQTATVTMTGTSTLAIAGIDTITSSFNMSGSGTLAITPALTKLATITMTGSGTLLTINVQHIILSSIGMVGSSTLVIIATDIVFGVVSMTGLGNLVITTLITHPFSVLMMGSSSLVISTLDIIPSIIMMSGQGSMDIAFSGLVIAAIAMIGSGVIILGGVDTILSIVSMVSQGLFVITTLDLIISSVLMGGFGNLVLSSQITHNGVVSMVGLGLLVISAQVIPSLSIIMSGQGNLVASGIRGLTALILMLGIGQLGIELNLLDMHTFSAILGSNPWFASLAPQPNIVSHGMDRWSVSLGQDEWSAELGV